MYWSIAKAVKPSLARGTAISQGGWGESKTLESVGNRQPVHLLSSTLLCLSFGLCCLLLCLLVSVCVYVAVSLSVCLYLFCFSLFICLSHCQSLFLILTPVSHKFSLPIPPTPRTCALLCRCSLHSIPGICGTHTHTLMDLASFCECL